MKSELLKSIIEDEAKLWNVVTRWYLSTPEIFQDDEGLDLEEIADTSSLEDFHYDGDVIEELGLTESETLELVLHWYKKVYDGEKTIHNEDGTSLWTFCESELKEFQNAGVIEELAELKNYVENLSLKIRELENIIYDKSLTEILSFEERLLAIEQTTSNLQEQVDGLERDVADI
jgi:hypothetical protein